MEIWPLTAELQGIVLCILSGYTIFSIGDELHFVSIRYGVETIDHTGWCFPVDAPRIASCSLVGVYKLDRSGKKFFRLRGGLDFRWDGQSYRCSDSRISA